MEGIGLKHIRSKIAMGILLLGAGVLLLPGNAAARHKAYETATGTACHAEESAAKETSERGDLWTRIQAILHPAEAEKPACPAPAARPEPALVPVDLGNENILGQPMASQEQCVEHLLRVNPRPEISVTPEELVAYYYEEGAREGIRPDVAFAQALKETGYFRYGGTVTPDQNNYCGLGTTSRTVKGGYFPTARMGVRAHIQHLLAYASTRLPEQPIVDPRYSLVRSTYGDETMGTWTDLNGRWAVPGYTYGQSIMELFRQILMTR